MLFNTIFFLASDQTVFSPIVAAFSLTNHAKPIPSSTIFRRVSPYLYIFGAYCCIAIGNEEPLFILELPALPVYVSLRC